MEAIIVITVCVVILILFIGSSTTKNDKSKPIKLNKPISKPKSQLVKQKTNTKKHNPMVYAFLDKLGQEQFVEYTKYFLWASKMLNDNFNLSLRNQGKVTLVAAMIMPQIADVYKNIWKFLTLEDTFVKGSISPNTILSIVGRNSEEAKIMSKELSNDINRDEDNYYIALILLGGYIGRRGKNLEDKKAYGMFHQAVDNKEDVFHAIFIFRLLFITMKVAFVNTGELLHACGDNTPVPNIIDVMEMEKAAVAQLDADFDNIGTV